MAQRPGNDISPESRLGPLVHSRYAGLASASRRLCPVIFA
jgi:hypothetical protein